VGDVTPIDALAEALAQSWTGKDLRWIQTHISHVFLAEDRVFKLRKAVALPFLDFSTRAARNADCLLEVALNRRLAPDVYLGVAPVLSEGGAACVGGLRQDLADAEHEHVVVMRRLREGRDALSLLERGQLGAAPLEAVARRLAAFHRAQRLDPAALGTGQGWLERAAAPLRANFESLRGHAPGLEPEVAAAAAATEAGLRRLAAALERRRREGRFVDGHGDLHLQHVWFESEGAEPLLVDCIEFSDELRRIDAASEVGFLAMDLRYRGRRDLAEHFLASYAAQADDFDLLAVVDFYAAYRAAVRAKVAALAAADPALPSPQRHAACGSAARHLSLAAQLLAPPGPGALVLLCGTVGVGKSSAARAASLRGLGVPIGSDHTRKLGAGFALTDRADAGVDQGLYTELRRESVYAALLERAAPVVASGRLAILDASFARRCQRDAARVWAEERGIEARLVEVRCPREVALERLRLRAARGRDPSDAGPDFLEVSLARFEPLEEWAPERRLAIDTSESGWEPRLVEWLCAPSAAGSACHEEQARP